MANITVEMIKAHLKARMKLCDDSINEIQSLNTDPNYSDSIKAVGFIQLERNIYHCILHDIERGVLMTEEGSYQASDDIYDATNDNN